MLVGELTGRARVEISGEIPRKARNRSLTCYIYVMLGHIPKRLCSLLEGYILIYFKSINFI